MDQNRILVIGEQSKQFRSGLIVGTTNLYEFSAVIWHHSQFFSELERYGYTETGAQKGREAVARLVEWVSQGHALIVVAQPLATFSYRTGAMAQAYRLDDAEPLKGVSFELGEGQLIEFCGPPSLQPLFQSVLPSLRYEVILKSHDLSPLLRVSRGRKGADQLVSGFKRLGNGYIIFAPPLMQNVNESIRQNYYNYLAMLPTHLTTSPGELPPWAEAFQTDEEKLALESIK